MRCAGREACLRGLFRGAVSWSVSKVCFGVCFGGLFRQSRTSQPYLKLHSPKKYKPKYPPWPAGCAPECAATKKMRFNGWTQTIFVRFKVVEPCSVSDGTFLWGMHPGTNCMALDWERGFFCKHFLLCFRHKHTGTFQMIAKIKIVMIMIASVSPRFSSTPSWWGSPWRRSPRRSPPVRWPSLRRGSTPVRQDPKLGGLCDVKKVWMQVQTALTKYLSAHEQSRAVCSYVIARHTFHFGVYQPSFTKFNHSQQFSIISIYPQSSQISKYLKDLEVIHASFQVLNILNRKALNPDAENLNGAASPTGPAPLLEQAIFCDFCVIKMVKECRGTKRNKTEDTVISMIVG